MTLTLDAMRRIRAGILSGEIAQDEDLTERALCERLGMSRTPVRGALQMLAGDGLVSYSAQRGYRLRRVSAKQIFDTYEVRAELEGLACKLMAQKGALPAQIAVLEAQIAKGDALLAGPFDDTAWSEMNGQFHAAILEGAENEALSQALRHATGQPLASHSFTVVFQESTALPLLAGVQEMHRAIARHILNREADRAAAQMREHIFIARDLILGQIGQPAD